MKMLPILVISILISSSIVIANDDAKKIFLSYHFDMPSIKKIQIGSLNYDTIIMKNSSIYGKPGEPSLPAYPSYILLPQNTKIAEINVVAKEEISLGIGYKIIPIEKSIPIIGNVILRPSKNEEIYSSKNPFPGKLFDKVGVYYFRGYAILVLRLYPVQYIPSTGEIFYYKEMKIKIKLKDGKINPLYRGLEKDKIEVMKKVDNPEIANTYATKGNGEYELLIITTEELKKEFEKLKEFHDENGIPTIIKSVEEIGNSPEDIRNYIRDAYKNLGIEYVLIGGDDDVVPAKMLWVAGYDENVDYYETTMPSDLYYACLDGTYNYDNDNKWGEPNDGDGGGDVDLIAEVYVGRACVGDLKEAKNFISKTISYMKSNDDYLKKVCLAGEYLGDYGIASWGGNYLDELIDKSNDDGYSTVGIPTRFKIDKLYDRDWKDNYWPKDEIIKRINEGVHIINHLGHSYVGYNMKMDNDDADSLENDKYCFIYSQGCYAGAFDYSDCIAEHFTVKTGHGAFAAIMNARYGFFWSFSTDGDSQRYNREFWDAIFGENITEIGRANQDSKEDNLYIINRSMMRWCYYQLNLFGDPSIKFHISNPPLTPSRPIGIRNGKIGNDYTFSTSTIDVDGDKIYYKWDWGDGNYSKWLGPYNSGEMCKAVHKWVKGGIYEVKVIAKDEYGMKSNWSKPLIISMPEYIQNSLIGIMKWLFRIFWVYFLSFFRK